MSTVTWSVVSTDSPMGQQRYEGEIQKAMAAAGSQEWSFRLLRLAPLRSKGSGVRRYPARLAGRAPLPVARAVGWAAYRTKGLVHRFDLRLPPSEGPEVVTVHDLPPLRFDDEGKIPTSAKAGARRASAIITPSRFAADEVLELLGVDAQRIHVVPYGVSGDYQEAVPATNTELKDFGIRPLFVVHAAGASKRKNLSALAAAWAQVAAECPDVDLVLAGPKDERREEAFRAIPAVRIIGSLPGPGIASLMRRAAAVVVPSTYEGFGLPALEGMMCGTPVVAARCGALPEVCGDSAVLVQPDGEGIAEGLLAVLRDQLLADRLKVDGLARAAHFSWEQAAKAHLRIYRAVLDSGVNGRVC